MAMLARNGNKIIVVIYTNDNKGSFDLEMTSERLARIRKAEQEAAMEAVAGLFRQEQLHGKVPAASQLHHLPHLAGLPGHHQVLQPVAADDLFRHGSAPPSCRPTPPAEPTYLPMYTTGAARRPDEHQVDRVTAAGGGAMNDQSVSVAPRPAAEQIGEILASFDFAKAERVMRFLGLALPDGRVATGAAEIGRCSLRAASGARAGRPTRRGSRGRP